MKCKELKQGDKSRMLGIIEEIRSDLDDFCKNPNYWYTQRLVSSINNLAGTARSLHNRAKMEFEE